MYLSYTLLRSALASCPPLSFDVFICFPCPPQVSLGSRQRSPPAMLSQHCVSSRSSSISWRYKVLKHVKTRCSLSSVSHSAARTSSRSLESSCVKGEQFVQRDCHPATWVSGLVLQMPLQMRSSWCDEQVSACMCMCVCVCLVLCV